MVRIHSTTVVKIPAGHVHIHARLVRYCRQCGCRLAADDVNADCVCSPCQRTPYNARLDADFKVRFLAILLACEGRVVRAPWVLCADRNACRDAADYWRRKGLDIRGVRGNGHLGGYVLTLPQRSARATVVKKGRR